MPWLVLILHLCPAEAPYIASSDTGLGSALPPYVNYENHQQLGASFLSPSTVNIFSGSYFASYQGNPHLYLVRPAPPMLGSSPPYADGFNNTAGEAARAPEPKWSQGQAWATAEWQGG